MFFERGEVPLVQRVEQRDRERCCVAQERGEGRRCCAAPGAVPRPHFDFFDPAQPGTVTVLKQNQRVGTLLMYLRVPQRGDATVFPDAGLEVEARQGHALFFGYDRPHESTGTLHGGAPVIEGENGSPPSGCASVYR